MKFFVVSDLHSFFTSTKKALKKAGWDEDNPNHKLIICGDAFDRGEETSEILNWLLDLLKANKLIYVKGNHDILMQQMLNRGQALSHDIHNGTQKSFFQLLNFKTEHDPFEFDEEECSFVRALIHPLFSQMTNYFETKNYIFVHSWIPLLEDKKELSKPLHLQIKPYKYNNDWKNASEQDWEKAMWGNPFLFAKDMLNQTGKTIVFGHWHCSAGYVLNNVTFNEFGADAIWEPYINKEQKIIGIDRCTAYTNEVNVLVLEDEEI